MMCPQDNCAGRLRFTHTYSTKNGRTSSGVCTKCRKKATMVQFIAKAEPAHGEGAAAIANKINSGELTPTIQENNNNGSHKSS